MTGGNLTAAEIVRAALDAARVGDPPTREIAEALTAIYDADIQPTGLTWAEAHHARQVAFLCRAQYLVPLTCPACEARISPVDLTRARPSSPKNECPRCDVPLRISLGLVGEVWLSRIDEGATA